MFVSWNELETFSHSKLEQSVGPFKVYITAASCKDGNATASLDPLQSNKQKAREKSGTGTHFKRPLMTCSQIALFFPF